MIDGVLDGVTLGSAVVNYLTPLVLRFAGRAEFSVLVDRPRWCRPFTPTFIAKGPPSFER